MRKCTDEDHSGNGLDIIGNGRVTLALLKKIISSSLVDYFSNINVWMRRKFEIQNNTVCDITDNINEDIFNLYRESLNLNTHSERNRRVSFRKYETISDLSEILELCVEKKSLGKKHILVIAPRYRTDELKYVDTSGGKEKLNTSFDLHLELLNRRLKTISTAFLGQLPQRGEHLKKHCSAEQNRILCYVEKLDGAISEWNDLTNIGHDRLYNLRNSAIGIRELSVFLNKCGKYRGTILNLVNEVDSTNKIFVESGAIETANIVSPCEHDRMRAAHFVKKHLACCGVKAVSVDLFFLGGHNHTGFIPEEFVQVNGRPLSKHICKVDIVKVLMDATHCSNAFGEKIFLYKGSSDEDVVESICGAMSSVIFGGNKISFRASHYLKEFKVFTGVVGSFNDRGEFCQSFPMLSDLQKTSLEKILYSINNQKIIDNKIKDIFTCNHERKQ